MRRKFIPGNHPYKIDRTFFAKTKMTVRRALTDVCGHSKFTMVTVAELHRYMGTCSRSTVETALNCLVSEKLVIRLRPQLLGERGKSSLYRPRGLGWGSQKRD